MSLRILFADDSMTAQNIGKKILTDAGYEVVAVSNGAAAVKKIAEQKPDIIILDVYMPGYSGLEVCEKVRASIETLKTPVLLTVGKMEPYKPEDASRVRADGVIIKPFEASDLLAIVKKLEERIVPKAPPIAEQTILLDRPPDFSQFEHESFQVTPEPHPEERSTMQPMIAVPDEMASSAAFGDFLGMDTHEEPAPAVVVAPPPVQVPPAPIEIDAPMSNEFEAKTAVVEPEVQVAQVAPPEPVAIEVPVVQEVEAPGSSLDDNISPAEEVSIEPVPVPVQVQVEEPVAIPETVEPVLITHEPTPEVRRIQVHPDPAFEPPVTAASIEVPHATEPALEPTLRPAPEVHYGKTDPGLVTHEAAIHEFPTRFGVDNPEEVPVGIAAEVPELQATEVMMPSYESAPEPVAALEASAAPAEPAPVEEEAEVAPTVAVQAVAASAMAEDDFEARVARAMSVYEQSMEAEIAAQSEPEPVEIKAVVPPPVMEPPVEHVVEPMPAPEPVHAPVIHVHEVSAEPSPVAVAAEPEPFMPPPVVVSMPPVAPPEPEPMVMMEAQPPAPPMEPPAVVPEPSAEVAHQVAAQIEAEIPAATAAAASAAGADDHMVAAVVQRVMDRLKPGLIEEIVRELKEKR
ncbi:MAG: response regulator [Acidobacteriia bacterium]|nr:response regulator [Terriglobia bacterium]